jgi:hypothetical protein
MKAKVKAPATNNLCWLSSKSQMGGYDASANRPRSSSEAGSTLFAPVALVSDRTSIWNDAGSTANRELPIDLHNYRFRQLLFLVCALGLHYALPCTQEPGKSQYTSPFVEVFPQVLKAHGSNNLHLHPP